MGFPRGELAAKDVAEYSFEELDGVREGCVVRVELVWRGWGLWAGLCRLEWWGDECGVIVYECYAEWLGYGWVEVGS